MSKRLCTIGIILIAVGTALGFFASRYCFLPSASSFTPPDQAVNAQNANVATQTYPLINPTVISNTTKHFIINFQPLKQELTAIQKKYQQKTYVFFDYLNNASSVGLNEKDMFTAASTIKVPLAMTIMKSKEEGRLNLSDSYALSELDLDDGFGELFQVGADKQFTVEELMSVMLERSDNTAAQAIYNIIKKIGINDPLGDVYGSMGWEKGDMEMVTAMGQAPDYQQISLKILSNMFLSLYNAQYVNTEDSQKILEYLTKTPFNDKIVAGVPKDIRVAHKIGSSEPDSTFSDCGIVYAPNRNYILCLGSNGGDEKRAAEFMAEASKAVYQFVINN